MQPTPENIESFKHARWRVRFTAHLIALHEGISHKDSAHWREEHEEYLKRHAVAKEHLNTFPTEWDGLYP